MEDGYKHSFPYVPHNISSKLRLKLCMISIGSKKDATLLKKKKFIMNGSR